jgi:nitrogen regulatory protein PII
MKMIKRIEIITDEQEMDKILEKLDLIGVPGYTVIHNITGKSPSSTAKDDLPIAGLSNVYLLCFCVPELVDLITKEIVPIMNKFGGVFYLSDALEINSIHCGA